MKRILMTVTMTVLLALGMSGPAWASCTTHSYSVGGRYYTCTTCCYGMYYRSCSTTCH